MKIKQFSVMSESTLNIEFAPASPVCVLCGRYSDLALDLMRELITGADGVAIGRAAVGCPEIFSDITETEFDMPKIEQIKFHYEELIKVYGERFTIKYMRSHLAGYLSGKYKNSQLLVKLLKMEKYTEILAILVDFMRKI